MAVNERNDLWVRCYVFKVVVFSAGIVGATTGLSEEPNGAESGVDGIARGLSKDSAIVVANHLTQVVRALRDGGPPMHMRDEEKATWTLGDWLQKEATQGNVCSDVEYLADYRRAFFKSWCEYLGNRVWRDSNGELRVGHGIGFTLPNVGKLGTLHGHKAGEAVARNLQTQVRHEASGHRGGIAKPTMNSPARDAFLYIFKEFVGGPVREIGPGERLGLQSVPQQ